MADALELPTESTLQQSALSVTEQDMIELFRRFITLQDQFAQLTTHVESLYTRLNALETAVANKVFA